MGRFLPGFAGRPACFRIGPGQGPAVPTQTKLPPLAMSSHHVKITLEDQVALTHLTQTFRNDTSGPLEANLCFPRSKGASVKKLPCGDGKEVAGELVEADQGPHHLHRHRSPDSGPRPARIHRQNLLRVRRLPPCRPTANKKLGHQLHLRGQ